MRNLIFNQNRHRSEKWRGLGAVLNSTEQASRKMKKAKLTPVEIAKWFINRVDRDAGDVITHLKVQKLVYYAQAWYLANFNKPLFDEDLLAWTHGPVAESVWNEFKNRSFVALRRIPEFELKDNNVTNFLEHIYSVYGKFGAKELERLTHEELPWTQTRGDLPLESRCSSPIDKILMRDYYAKRIKKTWPSKIQK